MQRGIPQGGGVGTPGVAKPRQRQWGYRGGEPVARCTLATSKVWLHWGRSNSSLRRIPTSPLRGLRLPLTSAAADFSDAAAVDIARVGGKAAAAASGRCSIRGVRCAAAAAAVTACCILLDARAPAGGVARDNGHRKGRSGRHSGNPITAATTSACACQLDGGALAATQYRCSVGSGWPRVAEDGSWTDSRKDFTAVGQALEVWVVGGQEGEEGMAGG